MSNSKHDDTLPPSIGEALKQIHEPPATPREEMWQGIQAKRQERKVVGRIFALPTPVRLFVAAAAILLVGFFVGRLWEDMNTTPEHPADTASAPNPGKTAENVSEQTEVAVEPGAAPAPESADLATAPGALNQAQLLHAANHFTRSGVLLAQFAESVQDEDPLDPELHAWARDLLSNTRLLLDSPLAADPEYRKLLRDLEFTLAQVVQASSGKDEKEEHQWVAGQVSDRSLVERLRLIVPALPGSRDI